MGFEDELGQSFGRPCCQVTAFSLRFNRRINLHDLIQGGLTRAWGGQREACATDCGQVLAVRHALAVAAPRSTISNNRTDVSS